VKVSSVDVLIINKLFQNDNSHFYTFLLIFWKFFNVDWFKLNLIFFFNMNYMIKSAIKITYVFKWSDFFERNYAIIFNGLPIILTLINTLIIETIYFEIKELALQFLFFIWLFIVRNVTITYQRFYLLSILFCIFGIVGIKDYTYCYTLNSVNV
jgi:hypothetical protein